MAPIIDVGRCLGCSLCVVACPEEAITARCVASIDQTICVDCLQCLSHCPVDAIEEAQP